MRAVEKRLRNRIKNLELELQEVKDDRQKFRDFFTSNFRFILELHGKGQYWNMSSMIETYAKLLSKVKFFYW